MASGYNIFKDLKETKEAIVKNELGFYTDKNERLILLVENYFNAGKWTKNESDLILYQRVKGGMSIQAISTLLDMNYNTLRARLSRLSKKLCDTLFEGKSLNSICTSTDDELLTTQINFFQFILKGFDFYSEFSTSVIRLINKVPYLDELNFTETDIFNALAFLSMHSKTVIEYQLQNLNISALEHVIEVLSSDKSSKELGYFDTLQGNYKKAFNMREETINKIKEKS